MIRLLAKITLLLGLAALTAAGIILAFSDDPRYTALDWLSLGRYQQYDAMIADAAAKHEVDPLLLKALIWRESEFHPHKTGAHGERGLMQVSMPAAYDWAKANKVETIHADDLFSPRMNLEIGTWYLRQKLNRWAHKDDPLPFALAEYNAGRTRIDQWATPEITADEFRTRIPFPSTRAYVETILHRYAYYQAKEKAP